MTSTALPVVQPRSHRALVVDDEGGVNAMIVSQLGLAGWDAVMATCMSEAKAVIEDQARGLDLVFVDIKLPDGDGMDLIPMIRTRTDRPDVVVITGFQSEASLLSSLRAGVLDYLNKPFSMQDVAGVLRAKSIRSRDRLGVVADRFERVDEEFASVHRELAQIRDAIKSWDALLPQLRAHGGPQT